MMKFVLLLIKLFVITSLSLIIKFLLESLRSFTGVDCLGLMFAINLDSGFIGEKIDLFVGMKLLFKTEIFSLFKKEIPDLACLEN